jgi:hypothetical protein
MLPYRVQIVALCAGGWVSVVAAHMGCSDLQLPNTDPRYHCQTVATNSTWVNRISSIVVNNTDPGWCPVIIDGPAGSTKFQSYASNVQLNASAVDPAKPRIDFSFANANNVAQKSATNFFTFSGTQAVTTTLGDYTVGTAGNVATKRDFAHNTIYTTGGPATGDVWLDYNYLANPSVSGPTTQPNPTIILTANTPRIQQPATYQWYWGTVAQTTRTGSPDYYQKFSKVVSSIGSYTFKVVIVDHWGRSYTVSKTVQVTAVGCGGKIC